MLPPVQEVGPRRRRQHRANRLNSRPPGPAAPPRRTSLGRAFRVESIEHHADIALRLPGRRAGLGRGHDALYRPHALAERHHDRGRGRSAPPSQARDHRSAAGLAFPQGAGGERHHDCQPRAAGRERIGRVRRGIAIYDVSRPSTPKLITKWRTAGRGVHRYDFDGRYAYLSPTAEGYVGNIMMILDLADPA